MIMMMMNAERNGRNSDADVILCNWIIAMIMQLKKKDHWNFFVVVVVVFFDIIFHQHTRQKTK